MMKLSSTLTPADAPAPPDFAASDDGDPGYRRPAIIPQERPFAHETLPRTRDVYALDAYLLRDAAAALESLVALIDGLERTGPPPQRVTARVTAQGRDVVRQIRDRVGY